MHDDHEHKHGHVSGHGAPASPADKERMLLTYMLEHNREHTAELRALAEKLRARGDASAAEKMEDAAARYDAGDALLAEALGYLE